MRISLMRCLLIACIGGFSFHHDNATALETLYGGFSAPTGIAFDSHGALYVSNWGGGSVEKITPEGHRSTIITDIASPAGIVFDADDTLYVASYSGDYIDSLDTAGRRMRVADGLATPTGLTLSHSGALVTTNRSSGQLVAIDIKTGEKQVLAHSLSLPVGVAELPDTSFVVSQYGGRVTRILRDGTQIELGAAFSRPGVGIVSDGPASVLVVDNGANVVRRVEMNGNTESVMHGMAGSLVALGRDLSGNIYAGTWGAGNIYQIKADER